MNDTPAAGQPFVRLTPDGERDDVTRELAEETPIALELNGIGYAVLMATPADIEDLVAGFLIAERLQMPGDAVVDVALHRTGRGIVARANLPAERTAALLDRVRHRATDSSCGLCGIENLEQAIRPLPPVTATSSASEAAMFGALAGLAEHQTLNRRTGAVHAAAWADADGTIRLVREDVGRHNAFDKLIGAMRRTGSTWDGGFALLSSRCSFELVEKAALANCPMLVTISAPTRLAFDSASEARLALRVLARPDAVLAGPT
ncbi:MULTISPECIES: formate dehydrogenase accessory sulfurtransferase FdhD [unclassified Sphingopyxis]|uniref:formate dehydrogenase accessory sulfurtransferase FdhD n=1 Tax=unclassified Sphingopyxis TaxID=2614943 RepID=UPI0024ADAFC8|nr:MULTISPECIES: formate dehydrogenase accessory sulfurtransferase FdhD [unclassified Sphingopyxis]